MRQNSRVLWVVLPVLAGLGCASKGSTTPGAARKGEFAQPVSVAAATRKSVPLDLQLVGNVEAYSTITVKPQVSGILTKTYFQEGDYVKAGDPLFDIDRRPFEAQVNQAEANVARDRAGLGQAEANLARDLAQEKFAQAQAARYAKLFSQGIISSEQTDQVRTSAEAMGSAVSADRAAIQSARAAVVAGEAAVENARVQLSYTSITSPITGRTGNLNIKVGNVVTANGTDLITINQVEPIYVTFAVPESQIRELRRYMASGKLPVFATPEDNPGVSEQGTLTFVDNTVDPQTATIKLKGTFTNPDRKLWPGEFVRVALRMTVQHDAVVVPNQAVQTGQDGQYVFVVKQDRTVESRPITTGARFDQDLVVEKGLEGGETVVTEGQLRLAPGSRVQLRDERGGPGRRGKRG